VAEPYQSETWLTPVLSRDLRQVAAPDDLWRKMQQPRVARVRKQIGLRTTDLMLVCTLLAMAVWGIFPRRALSPQSLAIAALNRGPEDLDLQSDTVSEIRAWVKTRTGLDLPLPAETSQMVRLKGVCAVKGGFEVSYRVSGHNAALLVSKASSAMPADTRHRFLKCESTAGTRVSSWIMHGQLYTLAYASPGDSRDECQLCHAVVGPLTAVN